MQYIIPDIANNTKISSNLVTSNINIFRKN